MAKRKPSFRYFSVGKSEYIEISDDIFQVLGRWSNWLLLIYNNKAKPKWSESKFSPDQIIECGEGYFFVEFKAPKPIFLGNSTKGSFFKFYNWLLGELKIEAPIEAVSKLCEDEERCIMGGKQKYKAPLLSSVCKSTWNIIPGKDVTKESSYYPGQALYHLHTPFGELSKEEPKKHLMIEIRHNQLPPYFMVEQRLQEWTKL